MEPDGFALCPRSAPCKRCAHMLGAFQEPCCQMPECTQTLTVDTATKFCNEHMQVKRAYAAITAQTAVSTPLAAAAAA